MHMRGALVKIIMGMAVLLPSVGYAAGLTLSDTTGDPSRVDVLASTTGSFSIDVTLTIDNSEEVNGLSFWLNSLNTNTAFSITGRTISFLSTTTGDLDDPNSTDTDLTTSPDSILSPTNARDIGLTTDVGGSVYAPGGQIMSLTLTYQPLSAGDYHINIHPASVTNDNSFVDHDLVPGPDYVVHVVPEPGMAGLLAFSLLFIRRRS